MAITEGAIAPRIARRRLPAYCGGVTFPRLFILALAGLLLGGCDDGRRDIARAYLQGHPPAGFTVVSIPETLPIRNVSADASEMIATVRYRSTAPTVEPRSGFDLPAGRASVTRLEEIRGWALSTLPADTPQRASILSVIADAHAPFPVKRVVSPAGTEVDSTVTLTLLRAKAGWRVAAFKSDATVPGQPDADPAIPFENAPAVEARLARLDSTAARVEAARREYLAARKLVAERSLARLRARLRAGQTFTAPLPDGARLRLIVTRGLESAEPAIVMLTTQNVEPSTVRYTGALEQNPAGETIWRAPGRPALVLATSGSQLLGELLSDGQPSRELTFRPAGAVDLIPESLP